MESIVLYDKEKVLGKLVMMAAPMKRLSNSTEYNQLGAWVGDGTPGFLIRLPESVPNRKADYY